MYIEIVIGLRQKYLEEYEKQEKSKMFIKYRKEVKRKIHFIRFSFKISSLNMPILFKVDVDMDMIQAMIEKEYIKEREGKSSATRRSEAPPKMSD